MNKFLVTSFVLTTGLLGAPAFAQTCEFSEGPVSYSVELISGQSAVVMYGQVGDATGSGFELSYVGTGPGGAGIYQDQKGHKLFVINQGSSVNLKLMDINQGEMYFQDKVCKTAVALDPKAIGVNVEKALSTDVTMTTVINAISKSEGMVCKVNQGLTQIEQKTEKNEDYNSTYEVKNFKASLDCKDPQYQAYAGRIDLSGSFDNNGTSVRLQSLSVNRGGN